jgi:hypothetical protein
MTVSQVTDEVLYTGLIEMQELPELDEWVGGEAQYIGPRERNGPTHWYIK